MIKRNPLASEAPRGIVSGDREVGETGSRLAPDSTAEFALVPRAGFFEGQIAVVGETRIDGTVLGSLQGPGDLVLGIDARVEGRIECERVSSQGEILGPIVARKHAHLGDGARFEGDLVAPAVEVDGDVVWNGKARVRP